MSRFVVVVFPSETQAYEGTRSLKDLHTEGSLTVYGMAVISKDSEGRFAIKDAADRGPLGTVVGTLTGSLIGLLAGPTGLVAGSIGGTLIGSMVDVFNYGVSADFVAKVSDELTPGRCAVVAEVAENWTVPLDTRMEAAGGIVLRTWRADFEDEQIAKEIAENQADWKQLRAEHAAASAEAKANLKAKLDQTKANLDASRRRVEHKLEALDKEVKAKVAAMEQQVASARANVRDKINQRITAVRAAYKARTDKLKQAMSLAKEALA